MNPKEAMTAARNGAALLDKHKPGWFREIDLPKLKMRERCLCVLGQLYTDYFIGVDRFKLSTDEEEQYGFFPSYPYVSFAQLDHAWTQITMERLNEQQPAQE